MEVPSYRVVVLGESGVGKSSLVQRYVFNVYSEGGPESGREEETKTIRFKTGQQVELRICDTQGQERADLLTDSFYKDIDAIIFVYDVTNSRSLWNCDVWIRDWNIHIPNLQSLPVLLVGTKVDVRRPQVREDDDDDENPPANHNDDEPDRDEDEIVVGRDFVDPDVVRGLVRQHQFIRKSLKCSARTGAGVDKVFETIAAEVAMVKEPPKRTCVCL